MRHISSGHHNHSLETPIRVTPDLRSYNATAEVSIPPSALQCARSVLLSRWNWWGAKWSTCARSSSVSGLGQQHGAAQHLQVVRQRLADFDEALHSEVQKPCSCISFASHIRRGIACEHQQRCKSRCALTVLQCLQHQDIKRLCPHPSYTSSGCCCK